MIFLGHSSPHPSQAHNRSREVRLGSWRYRAPFTQLLESLNPTRESFVWRHWVIFLLLSYEAVLNKANIGSGTIGLVFTTLLAWYMNNRLTISCGLHLIDLFWTLYAVFRSQPRFDIVQYSASYMLCTSNWIVLPSYAATYFMSHINVEYSWTNSVLGLRNLKVVLKYVIYNIYTDFYICMSVCM